LHSAIPVQRRSVFSSREPVVAAPERTTHWQRYTQTAQVANAGSCQIVATVQYSNGPRPSRRSLWYVHHNRLPALRSWAQATCPRFAACCGQPSGTLVVTGATGPVNSSRCARQNLCADDEYRINCGNRKSQVAVHGVPGYFIVPRNLVTDSFTST